MSAPKVGRRPQVGRADLVRVTDAEIPSDESGNLGAAIGYSRLRRDRDGEAHRTKQADPPPRLPPKPKPKNDRLVERAPLPFWRVETVEFTAQADPNPPKSKRALPAEIEPLTRGDLGRAIKHGAPDPPPPLVSWSRLRRFVEELRRRPRPVGDIDADAIVNEMGRGRPIERLPRLLRHVRVPRLTVIIDRADRLIPFWRDQVLVWSQLEREFGRNGLSFAWWKNGPPTSRDTPRLVDAIDPGLARGDAVLALSDLGVYAGEGTRAAWAELGAALADRGVTAGALLPCPRSRWPSRSLSPWRAVDWSKPARTDREQDAPDESERVQRRDELLALLSWTVVTEPELLREVRVSLPWMEADVATEADAWNHPELGRHPLGLLIVDPVRRSYQAQLQELARDASWAPRLARAVEIVRRRHETEPREIWLEEVWILELLGLADHGVRDDERVEARRFAQRLRKTVELGKDLGPGISLRSWGRRITQTRVPSSGWEDGDYGDELVLIWDLLHQGEERVELPPGLEEERLAELREVEPLRYWRLEQVEGELQVVPSDATRGRASPLAMMVSRSMELATSGAEVGRHRIKLSSEGPTSIVLPEGEFELSTDCETLRLRRFTRPPWASGIGRDEHGLWASFEVGAVEQRMRWIPPGRSRTRGGTQHDGFWLADTPCTRPRWGAVVEDLPGLASSLTLDDIEFYLKSLSERIPGFVPCLPTKEQWLYASSNQGLYDMRDEELEWCADGKGGHLEARHRERLLILGSNPSDTARINLDEELRRIQDSLRESRVPIHYRPNVRIEELADLLHQVKPTIVHFIMHGVETGQLVFSDDNSKTYRADAREFAQLFAGKGVKMIYLNAGYSDPAAQELSKFVDCAIGMSGIMIEEAAIYFAASFYEMIGTGYEVEDAFERARASIELSEYPGSGVMRLWKRPRAADADTLGFRISVPRASDLPSWADSAGRDQYGTWASVRVGDVDLRMRWIPQGRFLMGSPEDEEGRRNEEGPQHVVTLTRGYWMAETPCTQALWQSVMGHDPSKFEGSNRPVEQVSWEDAQRFIEHLARRTEPGWALPTEAQWEYACRAGTTGARYGPLDEVAWYGGNAGRATHEVGQKLANAWGIHDMLGNVYEWCADCWGNYEAEAVVDPTGPSRGPRRVVRGGGWLDSARYVRAAYRLGDTPGYRYDNLGFRLVRGQGLRQAGERSESQSDTDTSKGGNAGAGDPPGSRPASPHNEEGR